MEQASGHPTPTQMDFVQFLLDREIITCQDAERIRERSRGERAPIGQVLIKRGALTVRQVMNLLAIQADSTGVRFGELAVRVGYISTLDLERALNFQREHRLHQIEILQQEGLVAKIELEGHIVGYVRFMELQSAQAAEDVETSLQHLDLAA